MSPPASEAVLAERPLCAEVSKESREPIAATASGVEHWLLVEHTGLWPYEPLDASVFADGVREHLSDQLTELARSRLLLIKQPGRLRGKRLRVIYGQTRERGQRFFVLDLGRPAELLEADFVAALRDGRRLGEPLDHPLLLVCTHGKRDRCCARYGQPLCAALHAQADPDWVWQASHVGGDRFAGNLVCMPEGLYFGRVGREQAGDVLRSYIAGRIELEHYRGRSCYPFAVQAAEAHVRGVTGLVGFHDLRLVGRHRTAADLWTVQLRAEVAGDVHEVVVAVERGQEAYLTCRADARRPARRFVARSHTVVG